MKKTLLKTFSMTALTTLLLAGCSPVAGSQAPESSPSPETVETVDVGFDLPDKLYETDDSVDSIVAGDIPSLDMSQHRADLESTYTPPPPPEPTPEQQEVGAVEQSQNQSSGGSQHSSNTHNNSSGSSNNSSGNSTSGGSSSSSGGSSSGSSNASRGVNGVYNLTTARNFLAGYCPGVNIESVNGSTSYYDPNRNMIMLGTNIIGGENRVYFVVMHELMHHYQNQQYSSQQWSTKLANGTLETEADRMTFQVAPNLMGQGHYTNSTASGAERSRLQQVINNGRAAGC